MNTLTLVVNGRTPSKKNSKQIVYVKGRPLILSSKDYKEWHIGALQCLQTQRPILGINLAHEIILVLYGQNRRKFDLSNKAESIMDLMVDAGVLTDDNCEVVPRLTLIYGGIDKENPRCEIEITYEKTLPE